MEVEVRGATLQKTGPKQGMLADFGDLKRVVQPVVDGWLDHFYLNETLGLENPTSEEVAYWVFNKIEPAIPGLVAVHIHETCTSACCYKPDNYESKT